MSDYNGYSEAYAVGVAMRRFGGGFIAEIGAALQHADSTNQSKIKDTWPKEWGQYLKMAKRMREFGGDR